MIETVTDGPVLRVTLSRGEAKNALNLEMVHTFRSAPQQAASDKSISIMSLNSNVPAVFSLGMDLASLKAGLKRGAKSPEVYAAVSDYARLLQQILAFHGVTIAVVDGMAVGGGVDLLAACDVVIASETSAFSIAQLRKGIFPLTTSGVVIPRVGQRAFLYWALSGQNWSAKKALAMGLISQVVPADRLAARVEQLVQQIRAYDAEALRLGMEAVRIGPQWPPIDRLEHLGALLALNCQIPREADS